LLNILKSTYFLETFKQTVFWTNTKYSWKVYEPS